LRNSCGSSITGRRLGRAPAQNKECNRPHGAARAVNCENMLDHGQILNLPHLQP
jgi:hypothetical protein